MGIGVEGGRGDRKMDWQSNKWQAAWLSAHSDCPSWGTGNEDDKERKEGKTERTKRGCGYFRYSKKR